MIVVREQPAFERVADGFPALVVLIEDLSVVNITVLLDHQRGPVFVERELSAGGRVSVKESADRICEPCRRLVSAMREQCVDLNMEPGVFQHLNGAGDLEGRQPWPPHIAARAGRGAFAQTPQLQRGPLELIRDGFQGPLYFVRVRVPGIRQRNESARFGKRISDQGLQMGHIRFQDAHSPPPFLRIRRSVEDVVMASYSFCVAWNAMGTWL